MQQGESWLAPAFGGMRLFEYFEAFGDRPRSHYFMMLDVVRQAAILSGMTS